MDTRRYEGIYHLPEAVFGCASFSIFPHAPKIPADFSLADTVNDALFLWPRCPRDCGDAVCIVHPSSPIELVGSPSLAVVERSPPLATVKSAATQHCRIRADVWRPCPTSGSSPSASDARGVQALAGADPAKSSDGPKRNNGYPHKDIESKWQAYWSENQTFRTPDQVDTSKPKFYALDMFPYPRCMPLFCRTP